MMRALFVFVLLSLCIAVGMSADRGNDWEPDRNISDHFDGNRFHNRAPYVPDDFWDGVQIFWALTVHRHHWPKQPVSTEPVLNEARIPCGVRATIIGHATVLLQVDSLNILTDPVMFDHIGLNRVLGMRRELAPGLSLEQLPIIDVILLSHNHFDHLDIPTLQAIMKRQPDHAPLVLTGIGNGLWLQKHDIRRVKEMDWGDSVDISGERIYFLEAVHESGRINYLSDKSLWGSFLIEAPSAKLYFGGDSAYGGHFKQIGESFGPITLAFLPIGAYAPHELLFRHHMNPEEAVRAHVDLKSEKSIGIHFGVFNIAADRLNEPVDDLRMARNNAKLANLDFVAPKPGDVFSRPCRLYSLPATQ